MNPTSTAQLRFDADPTNPGHFFACCGLFELACRAFDHADAWFEEKSFVVRVSALPMPEATVQWFIARLADLQLVALDPSDETASPIKLGPPFDLRLDWWQRDRQLKVWAGSMRSLRIAAAMKSAMRTDACAASALLNYGAVIYDPVETAKKVEPFYFDARRGASSQAVDIGFSPDALQITTVAYPAVEFLCLVGLQRFQPKPASMRRVFDYSTWRMPLDIQLAPAAVSGLLPYAGGETFRFESAFRTDQRKHKAFTPATKIQRSER